MTPPVFAFDNTFADTLEGFCVPASAAGFRDPAVLKLNVSLARELGLDPDALGAEQGAALLSGNRIPEGAAPVAQTYAGHQFGGFSPQLGDGRALLLGEIVDVHGKRRDLQLKGSGPTPFSRGGDGKATLASVLREYVISEAMYGLGIPTTRSLSVVATGEVVYRERELPGAVLARVAASHIRVGTFEFFAARRQPGHVRQLADYTLARHYPERRDADHPYLELLLAVAEAQAELVARWMHVGFIHGVMNTDNVTVSGETIDYGPCAFMDAYNPATVFSSIDQRGRYAYGNQPGIAKWNLARFAEALMSLLGDDETTALPRAQRALERFTEVYLDAWLRGMRRKLGLAGAHDGDLELVERLLAMAEAQRADFTSLFRALGAAARGDEAPLAAQLGGADGLAPWRQVWGRRLDQDSRDRAEIADAMDRVNPLYVPRNHKVEEALAAAVERQDLGPFDALLDALRSPFEPRSGLEAFARPAPPEFYPYQTFCGT